MARTVAGSHFDLAPFTIDAPYAGQPANERAKRELESNFKLRVQPVIAGWNAAWPATEGSTLKIEPRIAEVRSVSAAARFWGGVFAGGSGLDIKVKLTDAATGEVIGEPEFYQHANAWGATYSFGATDKTMLLRVATMVREYLKKNRETPTAVAVAVAPEVAD